MITDTKIKIMEKLLDLVDKELKFGCVVYCKKLNIYLTYLDRKKVATIGISERHISYLERADFNSELIDIGYNIIGKYDLGILIKWAISKDIAITLNKMILFSENFYWNVTQKFVELPLDKPPMERSEEEDKKLLEFMESVE